VESTTDLKVQRGQCIVGSRDHGREVFLCNVSHWHFLVLMHAEDGSENRPRLLESEHIAREEGLDEGSICVFVFCHAHGADIGVLDYNVNINRSERAANLRN